MKGKKQKKNLLQKMQDEERKIKHLVREIIKERRGTASKEGSKFWESFINNTSPGVNFRNKSSYDINKQSKQGKEGDDIINIKEKNQDNIGDFELLLPAFFTEILHKKDLEKAYHDLDGGNLCDSQNNYVEMLEAIRVGLEVGIKVLESCSSKKKNANSNEEKLSRRKCSARDIETMLAKMANRLAPSVPLREVDGNLKLDHDRCTKFKDQGSVRWSTWSGHWYNKKIYEEKFLEYHYSFFLPRAIYTSQPDETELRKFKSLSSLELRNNPKDGPIIAFWSQVTYYFAIRQTSGEEVSHEAQCANDFVEKVAENLAHELTSCLADQNIQNSSCRVHQSAAFELSSELMYAHLLPNANGRWSSALNFVMAVLMQEIPSVMLTIMSPYLRGPALDVLRKLDPNVPTYQVTPSRGRLFYELNESLVVGQLFAKYFLEKAKAGSLSRALLQPRTEEQGKTQLEDLDKTIWGYVAKYFPDGVESSNVIKYNYLKNVLVQECKNLGYRETDCLKACLQMN